MDSISHDSSCACPQSGRSFPARLPEATRLFVPLALLLLVLFAGMRAGLIWQNRASAGDVSVAQILSAFWVGLRFDAAVTCYLLLPFVVVGHLPRVGLAASTFNRRFFVWVFLAVVGIVSLLLIAEFEFFREFQMRYNQLALDYLNQAATVGRMLWYGFPILPGLLLLAVILIAFTIAVKWLLRQCFVGPPPAGWIRPAALAAWVPLLVIGMRGGLSGEPLRWGDAYRSQSEFVNAMSLNGIFTLGLSVRERLRASPSLGFWHKGISPREARGMVQGMLVAPGEKLLDPMNRTVLRISDEAAGPISLWKTGRPPNVVLVIMESFSARYCGAVGSPQDFTPEFNKLARNGVLFDRALSSGTHTHQGVFSTLLGFPNLPGYEILMQMMPANQRFASLPSVLKTQGYRTTFLYNGDFSWDNMRGFFQQQGVDQFIGADDFVRPSHKDKVWGVADGDVFNRANEEFERLARSGPFLGIVLTLSNHTPFDLPEPHPFAHTIGMGKLDERMDGIRYADWAVGRFIKDAGKLDYFANTLFVFVGDHGFHVPPVLTEVHVLYHHVPLLFYAPGLLSGHAVVHDVAGQTDILPSVLGLLDVRAPHASWGRNLFEPTSPGRQFTVFKASGGGQHVGMVRGDSILVLGPQGQETFARLDLGFPPSLTAVDDPSARDEMRAELRAYVRAALDDLTGLRAGPVFAAP